MDRDSMQFNIGLLAGTLAMFFYVIAHLNPFLEVLIVMPLVLMAYVVARRIR